MYVPAVPVAVVSVTETFLSNAPVTFSRTMHISPLVPSGILICVSWIETVAPMTKKRHSYFMDSSTFKLIQEE